MEVTKCQHGGVNAPEGWITHIPEKERAQPTKDHQLVLRSECRAQARASIQVPVGKRAGQGQQLRTGWVV